MSTRQHRQPAEAHAARKTRSRQEPSPRHRAAARKPFELVLLGATGFTGRQAVRAVLKQRPDAHWAVAGRDAATDCARWSTRCCRRAPGAPRSSLPTPANAASLQALARQAQVLFNLAGPYHATGDAVVAACIAGGTHYLDLTGETFWIQRLVREQHDAAARAGVKIMPCAGYEALPFDLATLWAAHQLRAQCGEPCASVTIGVGITGRPITDRATWSAAAPRPRAGAARARPQRLPTRHGLPAAARIARHDDVARRNALQWLPRYDDRSAVR